MRWKIARPMRQTRTVHWCRSDCLFYVASIAITSPPFQHSFLLSQALTAPPARLHRISFHLMLSYVHFRRPKKVPTPASYACISCAYLLSGNHNIPATATAPPTTNTISFPHPRLITASPVCNPGFPELVALGTPALPLGVSPTPVPPLITVTAVTTDLLPLGSVVVCTTTVV